MLLVSILFISSIHTVAAVENDTTLSQARDVLTDATIPLIDITDAYLDVYETKGGTKLTDYDNIPKDAYINVSYAFRILDLYDENGEEGQVKEGDYFSINMPAELINIAEFDEIIDQVLQVTYEGKDYNIANLKMTKDGGIIITFLEDVESLSDVTLHFSISGFLQPDHINDDDNVTFSLVSSGTVYSIGFIKDEPEVPEIKASIEKNASYDSDTNEITWTITVNAGESSGAGVDMVVRDMLGDNQTFVSGSTLPVGLEPDVDVTGQIYTFSLSNVLGEHSFTYKTIPTKEAFSKVEGGTTLVNNLAELYLEGEPEKKDDAKANITLTTDWIQKSGVVRTEDGETYIDWTIGLNYNDQTIPKDTIVSDTLPPYLTLEEDSVKRNGSLPKDYNDVVIVTGPSFTYQFAADATKEQTITFTTKVNSAYYQQQAVKSFINTAIITVDGVDYQEKSNGVQVSTNLLNKYGAGYDASTGLITWKLKVNENGQDFKDAVISDTFDSNQLFSVEYGIQDTNGVSFVRVSELSALKDAPNQYYYEAGELQIYLGDLDALDKPVLSFQTTVMNPEDYANNKTTNYSNRAILIGDGIETSDSTGVQTVTSQLISKENVGYDYNTRVLSWKVTVNQNNMRLPDAVVTDIIPAGQSLVLESIEIDGKKASENQFSLEDNNLIIKLYELTAKTVVTFQTKVTDLKVFLDTNANVTFYNTAKLNSGIVNAPDVSVTASKVVDNIALSKEVLTEYIKENGYIEWEVFVNANQVSMKDAVLNDVLQEGLELDSDSIMLYEWNQDAEGNRTIGDKISEEQYKVTYDYDTRNFMFYLPNGEQGYYLKFKTDVLKPGKYSNSISFGGGYTGTDSDSSSYYVTSSDVSAGVSGTNGSITVYKTNQEGEIITTGSEFELLDSKYNVFKTLTTDETGALTFDKLKLRTYYIREKTAPFGYAKSDQVNKITLSGISPELKDQTITIKNSLLTGNLFLKKQNQKGEGLAGGVFSLYEEGDEQYEDPIDTVMSEEGGIISFRGLKAGSYVVKEVKAPAGYYLTNEVRKAFIKVDSTNTISDVTVAEAFLNEAMPQVKFGSAQLFKSDVNNQALKGAEFGLYDTSGAMIQTAVSKEDGSVQFMNVPYGTYTIKEIVAPKGYEITSQTAKVVIDDSNETAKAVPYAIVNQEIKNSNTDDDTNNTNTLENENRNGGKGKEGNKEGVSDQLNNNQQDSSNAFGATKDLKKLIQAGSFIDEVTLASMAGIFIVTGIGIQYWKKRKKV